MSDFAHRIMRQEQEELEQMERDYQNAQAESAYEEEIAQNQDKKDPVAHDLF